jgi:hypothetical protein
MLRFHSADHRPCLLMGSSGKVALDWAAMDKTPVNLVILLEVRWKLGTPGSPCDPHGLD